MTAHDRFEALAGAVMLGEASQEERAAFDAHAAVCDDCRLDAACAPVLVGAIDAAQRAETWRPAVDHAVLARIRESRTSRFRVTVGALGWAVALSLVVNVAFVSGFGARMAGAFHASGETTSDVAAMRIRLESPAPHVPEAVPAPMRHASVAYEPRRRARIRHAAMPFPAHGTAAPPAAETIDVDAAASALAAGDVPDVLAGIDVDGKGDGAKHVAVEPRRGCDAASSQPEDRADPVATDAPAPCPAASTDPLR